MPPHRPDRPRTLGTLPVVLALVLGVTAGCAPDKPRIPTTSSQSRHLVVTKVLGGDSVALPDRQQVLLDAAVSADGTAVAVGWDHYVNDVGVEKVDAAAWYSTHNGRTWQRSGVAFGVGKVPDLFKQLPTAQNMLGVTAAPAGLIGVGVETGLQGPEHAMAVVWASKDGKVWLRVGGPNIELSGLGARGMRSVVTLGDLLVAAGWTTEHGDTDAAVWTSRDGRRWTRVHDAAMTRPGEQFPYEVITAGPGLVMVGTDGSNPLDPQDRRPSQPAVWTSTDGQKWQVQTLPVPAATRTMTYRLVAVTRGGPGLVAVGWAEDGDRRLPIVWTSHDGRTWQPGGTPKIQNGTSLSLRAVVSTGSTLVAFGESGPSSTGDLAAWTSTDARTWRPLAIPTNVSGGKDAQIVERARALPDGRIIAVGSDGTDRVSRPTAWLVEPRP